MKKLVFYIFLLSSIGLSACADPEWVTEGKDAPRGKVEDQANCRLSFEVANLCMSWAWEKKPTETQTGSLIFKFYQFAADGSAFAVDPELKPEVVLWMPSMGHGSSPVVVERISEGSYQATQVFFVMPGEWDLRFNLTENGEVHDQVVVPFIF